MVLMDHSVRGGALTIWLVSMTAAAFLATAVYGFPAAKSFEQAKYTCRGNA